MHVQRDNISSGRDTLNPSEFTPEYFDNQQKQLLKQQAEVDAYNSSIGQIHTAFQEKELTGSRVIVRLFKHNAITPLPGAFGGVAIRKDMKIKIPNKSKTGTVWVNNPFPYMYMGIICQTPVNKNFLENFPEFTDKVGHLVDLEFISFGQKIFYPDNHFVDPLIPDDEVEQGINPVPNFQGYIQVFPSEITAVHNKKVPVTYVQPEEERLVYQQLANQMETWRNSSKS